MGTHPPYQTAPQKGVLYYLELRLSFLETAVISAFDYYYNLEYYDPRSHPLSLRSLRFLKGGVSYTLPELLPRF